MAAIRSRGSLPNSSASSPRRPQQCGSPCRASPHETRLPRGFSYPGPAPEYSRQFGFPHHAGLIRHQAVSGQDRAIRGLRSVPPEESAWSGSGAASPVSRPSPIHLPEENGGRFPVHFFTVVRGESPAGSSSRRLSSSPAPIASVTPPLRVLNPCLKPNGSLLPRLNAHNLDRGGGNSTTRR